jgi:hypothetical protein
MEIREKTIDIASANHEADRVSLQVSLYHCIHFPPPKPITVPPSHWYLTNTHTHRSTRVHFRLFKAFAEERKFDVIQEQVNSRPLSREGRGGGSIPVVIY